MEGKNNKPPFNQKFPPSTPNYAPVRSNSSGEVAKSSPQTPNNGGSGNGSGGGNNIINGSIRINSPNTKNCKPQTTPQPTFNSAETKANHPPPPRTLNSPSTFSQKPFPPHTPSSSSSSSSSSPSSQNNKTTTNQMLSLGNHPSGKSQAGQSGGGGGGGGLNLSLSLQNVNNNNATTTTSTDNNKTPRPTSPNTPQHRSVRSNSDVSNRSSYKPTSNNNININTRSGNIQPPPSNPPSFHSLRQSPISRSPSPSNHSPNVNVNNNNNSNLNNNNNGGGNNQQPNNSKTSFSQTLNSMLLSPRPAVNNNNDYNNNNDGGSTSTLPTPLSGISSSNNNNQVGNINTPNLKHPSPSPSPSSQTLLQKQTSNNGLEGGGGSICTNHNPSSSSSPHTSPSIVTNRPHLQKPQPMINHNHEPPTSTPPNTNVGYQYIQCAENKLHHQQQQQQQQKQGGVSPSSAKTLARLRNNNNSNSTNIQDNNQQKGEKQIDRFNTLPTRLPSSSKSTIYSHLNRESPQSRSSASSRQLSTLHSLPSSPSSPPPNHNHKNNNNAVSPSPPSSPINRKSTLPTTPFPSSSHSPSSSPSTSSSSSMRMIRPVSTMQNNSSPEMSHRSMRRPTQFTTSPSPPPSSIVINDDINSKSQSPSTSSTSMRAPSPSIIRSGGPTRADHNSSSSLSSKTEKRKTIISEMENMFSEDDILSVSSFLLTENDVEDVVDDNAAQILEFPSDCNDDDSSLNSNIITPENGDSDDLESVDDLLSSSSDKNFATLQSLEPGRVSVRKTTEKTKEGDWEGWQRRVKRQTWDEWDTSKLSPSSKGTFLSRQKAYNATTAGKVINARGGDIDGRSVSPYWLLRWWLTKNTLNRPPISRHPLLELLIEDDLAVVSSLAEVLKGDDSNEFASCIVRVFDGCGKIMTLISHFIKLEVNNTIHGNTLFRTNTMATKIMSAYAKLTGSNYLRKLLEPLISDIIDQNLSLEIDPKKLISPSTSPSTSTSTSTSLTTSTSIDNQVAKLLQVTQRVLDRIMGEIEIIPIMFRRICQSLLQIVSEKFKEENRYHGIGGFIFLRFICPAIVAPDTYHITKHPLSPSHRRSLVLISKLLQNLANGIKHSKEQYMIPTDTFMLSNELSILSFYQQLAHVPSLPSSSSSSSSSSSIKSPKNQHHQQQQQQQQGYSEIGVVVPIALVEESLSIIHRLIIKEIDKLKERLLNSEVVEVVPYNIADNLQTVILKSGLVIEQLKSSSSSSSPSSLHQSPTLRKLNKHLPSSSSSSSSSSSLMSGGGGGEMMMMMSTNSPLYKPYFLFIDAILASGCFVIRNLITIVPNDSEAELISEALMVIVHSNGNSFEFIKQYIKEEVKHASSLSAAFTNISLVNHIIWGYFKVLLREFLCDTWGGIIYEINKENINLEIDPLRFPSSSPSPSSSSSSSPPNNNNISGGNDNVNNNNGGGGGNNNNNNEEEERIRNMRIESNNENLIALCKLVIDKLFLHSFKLNPRVAEMIQYMQSELILKFGSEIDRHHAAKLISKRVFAVAISYPVIFHLLPVIPEYNAKRTFNLISKFLSNSFFNIQSKEPYMLLLNDLSLSYQPALNQFFDTFCGHSSLPSHYHSSSGGSGSGSNSSNGSGGSSGSGGKTSSSSSSSTSSGEYIALSWDIQCESLITLHSYLTKFLPRITEVINDQTAEERIVYNTFDRLSAVIALYRFKLRNRS